jgi:gas vesicle protein
MDELRNNLYGLMKVVQEQQKMLDGTLAKLEAERVALARERSSMGQTVMQSVKQSMSGVADTVSNEMLKAIKPSVDTLKTSVGSAHDASNRLSASMDRVQSAWTWRLLLLSVGVLSIVSLTAYGLVWWERSQLEDLKATRQALQADINRMQPVVTDLEKRGGRLVWNNCGGKWCLQVEPGNWRDNAGPLAIPRGF